MPLRTLPIRHSGRLPVLLLALLPAIAGLTACGAPPPPATPPSAGPLALTHGAVPAALPPDDPASVPWRDANTLVERLKGHAGHLRQAPGTPAPAPDKAVPRRPAASETR